MSYMPCHQYQRDRCAEFESPILNVACKEDPAHLGRDFDAENIDIEDYDIETDTDLYSTVPNFTRMSVQRMSFPTRMFAHVVLGEFLEHCTFDAAVEALEEVNRVLQPGGRVTITFPKDTRSPEQQRPPHELQEYCEGITSWHQTVWTDQMLDDLAKKTGFREIRTYREKLTYAPCNCTGLGLVWEKP